MPYLFSRVEKLVLERLVEDAVEDETARLILADYLDVQDHVLSIRIRDYRHLRDLWAATLYGTARGVTVARRCASEVRQWGAALWVGRQAGHTGAPEWRDDDDSYWDPTLRECEGSERYWHCVMGYSPGRRIAMLCGRAHMDRLADRAVDAEDVPPDVEFGTMATVERIRGLLRGL